MTLPPGGAARAAAQIRIARPTDRLDEVVRFYRDGLGLEPLGGFEGHAGYDGAFLALRGFDVHLEFTQHASGSPGIAPSRDNLLVLYVPDRAARDGIADRLAAMGHPPVEPENPYWREIAVTVEDPDGWRVVLVHGTGIGPGTG